MGSRLLFSRFLPVVSQRNISSGGRELASCENKNVGEALVPCRSTSITGGGSSCLATWAALASRRRVRRPSAARRVVSVQALRRTRDVRPARGRLVPPLAATKSLDDLHNASTVRFDNNRTLVHDRVAVAWPHVVFGRHLVQPHAAPGQNRAEPGPRRCIGRVGDARARRTHGIVGDPLFRECRRRSRLRRRPCCPRSPLLARTPIVGKSDAFV